MALQNCSLMVDSSKIILNLLTSQLHLCPQPTDSSTLSVVSQMHATENDLLFGTVPE